MRFAVRRGALASNPDDQLTSAERPKPGLGRRRFLDEQEMERVLSAANDRYRAATACGLFAGPRLSELLGLVLGRHRLSRRGDPRAFPARP